MKGSTYLHLGIMYSRIIRDVLTELAPMYLTLPLSTISLRALMISSLGVSLSSL